MFDKTLNLTREVLKICSVIGWYVWLRLQANRNIVHAVATYLLINSLEVIAIKDRLSPAWQKRDNILTDKMWQWEFMKYRKSACTFSRDFDSL